MALVLAWSMISKADELASLVYTNIWINQLVGLGAAILVVGYLVWVSLKRRAVKIQGWRLELPGFRLSLAQMLIGAADVCAGAAVLFVLLPGGHNIGFETFVAIYIFAVMLGVASHAPGGLGRLRGDHPPGPVELSARACSGRAAALSPLLLPRALRGRAGVPRRLRDPQPHPLLPAAFKTDEGEVAAEVELGRSDTCRDLP